MKLTVVSGDGYKTVFDSKNQTLILELNQTELDDIENLKKELYKTDGSFASDIVVTLAYGKTMDTNEAFNTIAEVEEPVATAEIKGPNIQVIDIIPEPRINFERTEDSFHKMKRELDITGLEKLAADHPTAYGLAVAEFLRNTKRNKEEETCGL